jgi:5'-nucleotidase
VVAVRDGGGTPVHPRELPGLPGVFAVAVEGQPAFIVHAAARGWIDPQPDVVLSGINLGSNVGRAVLHSGTVGAALTASLHDWYGLAVSLDCGMEPNGEPHWDAATSLIPEVLDLLLAQERGTVFSLNAPDVPPAELGELREARLSPFGAVQVRVVHRDGDPHGTLHSSIVEPAEEPQPDSDVALLAKGHPTLTRLRSVAEVPGVLDGVAIPALRG